jgi:hypothetical protein
VKSVFSISVVTKFPLSFLPLTPLSVFGDRLKQLKKEYLRNTNGLCFIIIKGETKTSKTKPQNKLYHGRSNKKCHQALFDIAVYYFVLWLPKSPPGQMKVARNGYWGMFVR